MPPRSGAESGGNLSTRAEILSQVRELREREKRRDFIVIRGLQNTTAEQVCRLMPEISNLLGIAPVQLTEVRNVGNSNFFRAKVANENSRRELLLKCHQLRNTENFSRVYFNRDLTFQQRQDLRQRRAEASAQGSSQVITDPNSIPVNPNSIPVSSHWNNLGLASGRFACLQEEELGG
ncbi:MAG: hypothetical protein AAFN81_34060, partial [Bacteroidota bacterium]